MPYDDRITRKAQRSAHIDLVCTEHPDRHYHTKNIDGIGSRSIFFSGQDGRDSEPARMGTMPSRADVLRWLEAGTLTIEGQPQADTPEFRAEITERFDRLEAQYGFPCDCPLGTLVLDSKYETLPDVEP